VQVFLCGWDTTLILTNLTELDVACNNIGDKSPFLGLLSNLRILRFAKNVSRDFDVSLQLYYLRFLTNLTVLDVGGNFLAGNLACLSSLTCLTDLDLHNNELEMRDGANLIGLIQTLSSLKKLDIADNDLNSNKDVLLLCRERNIKLPWTYK
jgi:Leucine-rich repeat (LRR) protein